MTEFAAPFAPGPTLDGAAATNTLGAPQLEALLAIGRTAVTTQEIGAQGSTMLALEQRGLVEADRDGRPAFYCLTPLGLSAVAFLTVEPKPIECEQPIARIQRLVATEYKIPVREMVSQRRARKVARPRQIAMFLARETTPLSLPNIGRLFGWRDHTTVMHACEVVERLIESNDEAKATINRLRAAIDYDPDEMTDEQREADATIGSAKLRDAILEAAR